MRPPAERATLPQAARHFMMFGRFLREHGFAVAPEQVITFLAAVRLLGPRGIDSIRRAAHATLAPIPERRHEFDALFQLFFFTSEDAPPIAESAAEEESPIQNAAESDIDSVLAERANESGEAASAADLPAARSFDALELAGPLRRLRSQAHRSLPIRRAFRQIRHRHGKSVDLRKSMRSLVQHDGDVLELARVARKMVQRRILLLIDVSGSMKRHTDDYMRFAHALTQAASQVETFTFGTRLTRITPALRHRDSLVALDAAAILVGDWDGGTRIGDALQGFLAVPRYAAYARGAVVLVLSDGLERGDHDLMAAMVRHLRQRSRYLAWMTPLAADPQFRPETAALKAILPYLDRLGDGASLDSLVDCLFVAAGRDRSAPSLGRFH